MPVVLGMVKGLVFSWLGKLATKEFLEWAILWAAKKYVESTETTADDEWYAKIESIIKEGGKCEE